MLIKGIPVTLYSKTQTGTDPLNRPIFEETEIEVENVLIMPTTYQEQIEELNLNGAKVIYTLAIPKGDENDWLDKRVDFFGQSFRTIGFPVETIDEMTPTAWNKKVKVARYE